MLFSSHALSQAAIGVIGGPDFDLGRIYSGSQISWSLRIVDTGTVPLHIEQVVPSCGCTKADLSRNLLAPGDTALLSISFNSEHYTGRVRKSVTLVSNDPNARNLKISFIANVVGILLTTPAVISIVNMQVNYATTKVIRLQNSADIPVNILSVSDTANFATGSVPPVTLRPGDTTALTVTFKPTQTGVYSGEILITTDHPEHPVTRLNYYVEVRGLVR